MSHAGGSYVFPVCISITLHIILVVAVAFGWDASQTTTKKVTPRVVNAKLLTVKPKTQSKPSPQQKQTSKPKPNKTDLTKKRQQEQIERQKERERISKIQAEKVKKEKERKEKEKKAREKARQAELERKRQLEEQRRQEEERRRQAEKKRQREDRLKQMESELAKENALLEEEHYATTAQGYVALIASRIEKNWSRPPSARKGMQCELVIQLVPTGRVVNVSISKSSGNSAFDRSAVRAVKKVERFEELRKVSPQVFERHFRQLRLIFNPKDLRQ